MDVLVIGAFGRCGTALIDHLHDSDDHNFTYFDREPPSDDLPVDKADWIEGNITDAAAVEAAVEGRDAVIHLAAYPYVDGAWDDVHEPNIDGAYNVLDAVASCEVDTYVFASSSHCVGGYEVEHAPELYREDYDLELDAETAPRPDSYYGVTKAFGETLTRYYADQHEFPRHAYAIRIGATNDEDGDHPYAFAEEGVENGKWERGSPEYEEQVARLKAMWLSRRDFAHLIECCLADDEVKCDVFYGVSDNSTRWLDIDHARDRLGYEPEDSGDEWDAPPE